MAQPHILPAPTHAAFDTSATFAVTRTTPIHVPGGEPELVSLAHQLAALIGPTPGPWDPDALSNRPPVLTTTPASAAIVLAYSHRADVQVDEAYALTIDTSGVRVEASTAAGVFYGMQTLRQLLPPEIEYQAALTGPMPVPHGTVVDAPRYPWRGAMLDVARHFFGVEAVTRYIDLMAMYKLNRLHLHLSDDQGWRIEIPGWPRLTTVGAATEVNGGAGGFFTLADYDAIVAYAAERFVTIVPEIDLPGHTNAALVAYPHLSCSPEPPTRYTGIRVGFSTLCVDAEETYRFVDDVVRTLAAHTPGAWFHIGGDEVKHLTPEQYATFMARAERIVAQHGKQVIGWDEIAGLDLQDGAAIQLWRPFWSALDAPDASDDARARARVRADELDAAIGRGARLILSPADRFYLDMKYDSTTALGLAWAGYTSVRAAYDWAPSTWLDALPEGAVLGVEAPLWTETVATIADLEYLAFPRLAGVAERGWSSAAHLRWDAFKERLGAQGRRWEALGVNFYRAADVSWDRDR